MKHKRNASEYVAMKGKTMENIKINNEGKYIWGYELDLFRNFVVLKLVLKIIGISFLGVYVLSCLLSIGNSGFFFDGLWKNTKAFIILTVVMLVLAIIAYFIYAKIMDGKYCVIFEMDEEGIKHTQLDKQADKANMLSLVEAMAAAAAHNPGLVGSSLMKYGHTSIQTDFKKVKKVSTDRKSNAIILKYGLHNNQIYVEDEDYEEVLSFIKDKCTIQQKTDPQIG